MERLLFKCFRCETRLGRSSSELQGATFEDPSHISFESTTLFKDLPVKFETYKSKVSGKTKCYFFTSSNFFHCEIYFCTERILVKTFHPPDLKRI